MIKSNTKKILYIILGLFCCIILSSYIFSKKGKSRMDYERIVVATSPDYPPFEYISHGKLKGIDIDIIQEIANSINLKIELHEMKFSSIIGSIISGKADLGIAGITSSSNRLKSVDFSDEYFSSNALLVCNYKVNKISNIKNKKIGVQSGSVFESYIHNINKNNKLNIEVILLDQLNIASQHLLRNDIDCFITDSIKSYNMDVDNNIYTFNISNEFRVKGLSIAMKKNFKYKEEINNEIQKMKIDGRIQKIVNKYKVKSEREEKMSCIKNIIKSISLGVPITIIYTFISFAIGSILSIVIIALNNSNSVILSNFARFFISAIRGTPLILHLTAFYFLIPMLIHKNISIFTSCIIAFSINSSVYIAEIIRGGINAIPKGQFESIESINIPKYLAWKDIIIPQAIANSYPSLVNELIALTKESAIVSIIGGYDIMRYANIAIAEYYIYFIPLGIASIYYYVICYLIGKLGSAFEKKVFLSKL